MKSKFASTPERQPTKKELLARSRESALAAVQIFNNPVSKFKSENFIVLMIIAWTYLAHAQLKQQGVEIRYYDTKSTRKSFQRLSGGRYKYYSLSDCLKQKECVFDPATKSNLLFLINLRNEIEHQSIGDLDNELSGRYQACCMNYNRYLKQCFGQKYSMDDVIQISLHFGELHLDRTTGTEKMDRNRITRFIEDYDNSISKEIYDSPSFSTRLVFTQVLTSKPNGADRVIEFIDPNSPEAVGLSKEYWVQKETERPKFLPKDIIEIMQKEGFVKFRQHNHSELWNSLDAKNPSKGYGVLISGKWYWYARWVEEVRDHCLRNASLYQE